MILCSPELELKWPVLKSRRVGASNILGTLWAALCGSGPGVATGSCSCWACGVGVQGSLPSSAHLLSLIQLSLSESQAWVPGRDWKKWEPASGQTLGGVGHFLALRDPQRPSPIVRAQNEDRVVVLAQGPPGNQRPESHWGGGKRGTPPHIPDLLSSHLGRPGSGTKAREPRITSAFPRREGAALEGIFSAASP